MAMIIIEMRSSESSHIYTTKVNSRAEKKLERMMYDPILKKHVLFKQGKLRK